MKTLIFLAAFFIIPSAFCQPADYSTPEKTFETYKKAAQEGNVGQYLECLDNNTARIWSDIPPTPELMKREVNPVIGKVYKITYFNSYSRRYAVINFNDKTVEAPPYILCQSSGEWRIDFKSMTWRIMWNGREYKFIRPFNEDGEKEDALTSQESFKERKSFRERRAEK
ncbi:MAG: hypothetical protein PHO00_05805 [bacterium]|nr:hypothetical protein [bacterium]